MINIAVTTVTTDDRPIVVMTGIIIPVAATTTGTIGSHW